MSDIVNSMSSLEHAESSETVPASECLALAKPAWNKMEDIIPADGLAEILK